MRASKAVGMAEGKTQALVGPQDQGRLGGPLLLKWHGLVTRGHRIQEACFRWMNFQYVTTPLNSVLRFLLEAPIPLPMYLIFMKCWKLASFGNYQCLSFPPNNS